VGMAAALLPLAEAAGRVWGPRPLVGAARWLGRRATPRAPGERAWLQRAIAAIDRRLPGGERCYRRVLVEVALDPAAAAEPFVLGLDRSGQPRSGHAWLGGRRGRAEPYEVEISL